MEKWSTRVSKTCPTAHARPILSTSWRPLALSGARRTGRWQGGCVPESPPEEVLEVEGNGDMGISRSSSVSSAGSSQQPSCPSLHCTPKGPRRAGHCPLPGEAVGCEHRCLARPPSCNGEVPSFLFGFLAASVLQPRRQAGLGGNWAAGAQLSAFPKMSVCLPSVPTEPPLRGNLLATSVLATSLLASHSSLLSDRTLLRCETMNKNDFRMQLLNLSFPHSLVLKMRALMKIIPGTPSPAW